MPLSSVCGLIVLSPQKEHHTTRNTTRHGTPSNTHRKKPWNKNEMTAKEVRLSLRGGVEEDRTRLHE